tara:strand:- start:653 stop:955 length:303 start_codon:yes stop_codon:yes gene_type:complete
MKKKKLYFKKNDYYLVPGQTCNEIHDILTDTKQLARMYLLDIEGLARDSERYVEAMDIFEIVIDRFSEIQSFDSLELGGMRESYTFNELLKSAGVRKASS